MTTINITETILAGNLGEGWADQNEAASIYAEFLASKHNKTAERAFPGADIYVDVRVQYNATGSTPNAIVTGDADSLEMARLEDMLASDSAWNEFLDSDAARALM